MSILSVASWYASPIIPHLTFNRSFFRAFWGIILEDFTCSIWRDETRKPRTKWKFSLNHNCKNHNQNKTNPQPSQLRRVFQACSSWHLHSWQHLNFKLHSRLKLIKSNLSCLSRDFLVLIKVSFKTLEALMWPRVALVTCDDVPAMWVFSPQRSCDGCRHQFWHNWVSYHSFIKIDLYKLKSNWSFLSGKSEKLNELCHDNVNEWLSC